MANVVNAAYFGTTGTLVLDGDTHLGVSSFVLTPTTAEATVPDIGGDVQVVVGNTTWRAAIVFNQDHKTTDSLSKQSPTWHGTAVPFTYTPASGGEGRSGEIRWKHVPFGGDTGHHTVSADFGVIGQPSVVPAE